MRTFNWIFAIALLLPSMALADSGKPTARDVMRKMQSKATDVLVDYCIAQAPETRGEMTAGYAHFLANMDKAMEIWVAGKPGMLESMERQLAADPNAVADAEKSMADVSRTILDVVRQQDPHVFCPQAAERLQASTVESILQQLSDYDRRVEEWKRKNP